MASIYKRKKAWWIHYLDGGRHVQHSLKTRDEKVARYRKAEIEKALAEHKRPPQLRPFPIQKALDDYLAVSETTKTLKTFKNDRTRLTGFLDSLSVNNLHDITAAHIQHHLTKRLKEDGITNKTANHVLTAIKAFLNWCVKHQHIAQSPATYVSPFKVPKEPIEHLSEQEIDVLLSTAKKLRDGEFYSMVATAIYAGLRAGELFALEWENVDFKRKLIMVRDKPEKGHRTKSGRFRTIPMSNQLLAVLKPLRQPLGYCFFPNKPVRAPSSNFNRQFKQLVTQAKLSPETNWLELRRTFGSQLAQRGVSLYKIQTWLGHSDPRITMEHYAHLQPGFDEDINKLSS